MTTCPGCGSAVTPSSVGREKRFCTDPCRRLFLNRSKASGAVLGPLVQAFAATRHAKPGTIEADIRRFAMAEMMHVAGATTEADARTGRDCVAYVKQLMDSGTRWMDRRR